MRTSREEQHCVDIRGSAFGSIAARAREALRRGARWIVDRTRGLYRDPVPISAA